MAFAQWTGEPGYVGLNVWLAVDGEPRLLRYQIGGCFPGARAQRRPAEPTEFVPPSADGVFRLEPGVERTLIMRRKADGTIVSNSLSGSHQMDDEAPVSDLIAGASASARIPLAAGCDELSFHRSGDATLVRTSCSAGYARSLAALWAAPQHQHRQPLPIDHVRDVGRIEAPIVAVSNAMTSMDGPYPEAVKRGDKADPGRPCSFLLAAQAAADAPIFVYGLQPYCAYYPRDPSGAPFPPPPAP